VSYKLEAAKGALSFKAERVTIAMVIVELSKLKIMYHENNKQNWILLFNSNGIDINSYQ